MTVLCKEFGPGGRSIRECTMEDGLDSSVQVDALNVSNIHI